VPCVVKQGADERQRIEFRVLAPCPCRRGRVVVKETRCSPPPQGATGKFSSPAALNRPRQLTVNVTAPLEAVVRSPTPSRPGDGRSRPPVAVSRRKGVGDGRPALDSGERKRLDGARRREQLGGDLFGWAKSGNGRGIEIGRRSAHAAVEIPDDVCNDAAKARRPAATDIGLGVRFIVRQSFTASAGRSVDGFRRPVDAGVAADSRAPRCRSMNRT